MAFTELASRRAAGGVHRNPAYEGRDCGNGRENRSERCGDRLAREALFLAAPSLLTRVTRWSALKAWGTAIAKRRGLRRTTVAVARKLAVIMHRMWAGDSEFHWSRDEIVASAAMETHPST